MHESEQKEQKFLNYILELTKQIRPHFHKNTIFPDDDFEKDLGLDSLSRVELISRIHEKFTMDCDEKELYELQTPQELFKHILGEKEKSLIHTNKKRSTVKLEESSPLPYKAQTLIDVLHWHLEEHPERIHIQMYKDNNQGESITYEKLYNQSLKIASSLQELGLKPSEAVAIMLPTCTEYFYSFFGILMAGGIPVPIYPPARPSQLQEHMQRHTRILDNCDASILITIPEAKIVAELLKSYVQNIKDIVTPQQLLDSKKATTLPQIKADDIAFIQYTSGSTGDPKGVVLSHANLLANIRAMGEAVDATSNDVFVSWLPLYHDMGLIGSWLGSIYHASLFVVMSPLDFLSKPERWLWAIHTYRGTLSASPNFAYEYCLHRLKDADLTGLDLSSWRAAFNGAEAVSPLTIKNFSQFFKDHGFNEKSMTPVYGLAESSVGLVFPPMNRGPLIDHIQRDLFMEQKIAKASSGEPSLDFVSNGLALKGHEIRIVDSAGHELPSRHEGALQFRGPSSTLGYYKNQTKTDELLDGQWLNTGDQAYIAEGELYITGRVKDIIIRAGRNIYPDQLEKAIGFIEGIRKGCVAVFGGIDKRTATEGLVILAETKISDKDKRQKLISQISTLSADLLGVAADEIVLAEPGAVLKTSSGKIRRSATKELFEEKGGKADTQNLFLQMTRLAIKSLYPNMKRFYTSIKAYLFSGYVWLAFFFFASCTWISLLIVPMSMAQRTARFFAKTISRLSLIPLHLTKSRNIERDLKKSIIVLNHSSYIDAFVLFAILKTDIYFVAKSELKNSFFTRIPLQKLNCCFVERHEIRQSLQDTNELYSLAQEKSPLVFFPEGTFTRVAGLRPFHMGAFTLAVEKNLSIIPIAIEGTRSILRPNSWFIHAGEINLYIGERISLDKQQKELSAWEKALYLAQESRKFILEHCQEPDLIYEE